MPHRETVFREFVITAIGPQVAPQILVYVVRMIAPVNSLIRLGDILNQDITGSMHNGCTHT